MKIGHLYLCQYECVFNDKILALCSYRSGHMEVFSKMMLGKFTGKNTYMSEHLLIKFLICSFNFLEQQKIFGTVFCNQRTGTSYCTARWPHAEWYQIFKIPGKKLRPRNILGRVSLNEFFFSVVVLC